MVSAPWWNLLDNLIPSPTKHFVGWLKAQSNAWLIGKLITNQQYPGDITSLRIGYESNAFLHIWMVFAKREGTCSTNSPPGQAPCKLRQLIMPTWPTYPETWFEKPEPKHFLQKFSYDLEMKTREQNRLKHKRTELERFDWFVERIQTRVAFGLFGECSGEKTLCLRTFWKSIDILRFDVILQHKFQKIWNKITSRKLKPSGA